MNTLTLAKKLFDRYASLEDIVAYYGLLALYGLAQTAYEAKNDAWMAQCKTFLDRYPDQMEHPHYNYENYRIGGIATAWLCYMGLYEEKMELLDAYAQKTLQAPVDRNGIVCHFTAPQQERIWIDSVYAVTPFMLFAGLACDNDAYVRFAVDQCVKMIDTLMDKKCGLVHQSRGFIRFDRSKMTEDHWSRGNGWAYIGLTELITHLPSCHPQREAVVNRFVRLSKSLLPHQTGKGLWRQEIPLELSYEESSGTALFLYGYGRGLQLGLLPKNEFSDAYNKGIQGLFDRCVNEDFSTNRSCVGCNAPGYDKEQGTVKAYVTERLPYRDEHHSFGPFMLAFVQAYRNGFSHIERKDSYYMPG